MLTTKYIYKTSAHLSPVQMFFVVGKISVKSIVLKKIQFFFIFRVYFRFSLHYIYERSFKEFILSTEEAI